MDALLHFMAFVFAAEIVARFIGDGVLVAEAYDVLHMVLLFRFAESRETELQRYPRPRASRVRPQQCRDC